MNYAKDFRFDFLGALKCLCDCDDRLRNELAQFLEVEVCTIQASNNAQLFLDLMLSLAYILLRRTIYQALGYFSDFNVAIYNESNLFFFVF